MHCTFDSSSVAHTVLYKKKRETVLSSSLGISSVFLSNSLPAVVVGGLDGQECGVQLFVCKLY